MLNIHSKHPRPYRNILIAKHSQTVEQTYDSISEEKEAKDSKENILWHKEAVWLVFHFFFNLKDSFLKVSDYLHERPE